MYFYVLMIYIYVDPSLGNGPDWHSGISSRRRVCHFSDALSPSLLERLLKAEGCAAE